MICINEKNKKDCCGCTACYSICPKNAIEMKEDMEGFKYPFIDNVKCVHCGLCDKVCPMKNDVEKSPVKKAYVVQYKDEEILKNSTSGGAFVAIAKYIIDKKGYVFGAALNEEFELNHIEINSIKQIECVQGSKYIQSNLNATYKNVKARLSDNKYVLFVGTPCQVAGLKKYLINDYEKLITIDLVCRSVPSPKMWKAYLQYMEEKYKSKVKRVKFRDKSYGYHSGTLTIEFDNGKTYRGSNRICLYGSLFHGDKISRWSCYSCKFKTIDRCSDFTIFDSWNSKKLNPKVKDNNRGFTNVFIHTDKGLDIFQNIKNDLYGYEINYDDAILYTGGMVKNSVKFKEERNNIFIDLDNMSFEDFYKKYSIAKTKDYIIEHSKSFLHKIGFLRCLQKMRRFKRR